MHAAGTTSRRFSPLAEEHGRLRQQLLAILQALEHQEATAEQALRQLFQLRDQLTRHFRQEESEGLFSELQSAAPWLAERARQLQAEHTPLALGLESLLGELYRANPGSRPEARLVSQFGRLVAKFLDHERREDQLWQALAADEVRGGD